MYEIFFGLHARPFPAIPSTDHYFPAAAIEQARSTLSRLIERAEGAGLVTGPAGTGKSLLCQLIAEQFRQQFAVAILSSARLCSRRALLQNILFELKLPYRGLEEGELRLSLIDFLEPSERCPHGMLLLIDEAHTLPVRLLEEIRMITNLVRAGQPRVRLILAGNTQLEERLASPKLDSFQQRIAGRCYLDSLTQSETTQYVQHQLAIAGGVASRLFADDAYRAIFTASDGVPRLINQVCDHALILACAGGAEQVGAQGIEEAWADLQRLPAPRVASPASSGSSIVEFSVLVDDEAEPPAAEPPSRAAARHDSHSVAPAAEPAVDHDFELATEFEELNSVVAPPVPVAADPFGGSFEDEEVIIERFADWHLLPTIATSHRGAHTWPRGPHSVELIAEDADRELLDDDSEDLEKLREDRLVESVDELREVAQRAAAPAPLRHTTPATADLLAIWSQPVFAGAYGESEQNCWTSDVLPAGEMSTSRLLSHLRRT